jgi:hypothetical protein
MVFTESKFILAVIVPLSLFIALQGIGGSSYAKSSKKRFSPRTFVETQVIEADGSVNVTGKWVADFHTPFFSFAPTAFSVASFRCDARNKTSCLSSLIPARASPSIS